VFSLEEGLELIAARGRAMQAAPEGAMATVFAPEERVGTLLRTMGSPLSIAAVNGPSAIVVSGDSRSVASFGEALAKQGIQSRLLRSSRGFHSSLIDPALEGVERAAHQVTFRPPQLDLISNVTGS